MMDHSENTVRAAIKSLRDAVAPAVDPRDPQATEQLRLTIDFLEFLRGRIYDIHARHRYELREQISLAQELQADAEGLPEDASGRLRAALSHASQVHANADAHTEDLRAASRVLWATVRGVVRLARDAPAEQRQRISAVVVQGVRPLVELDSAWYLPFGLEPDPEAVPPIHQLLRERATVSGG